MEEMKSKFFKGASSVKEKFETTQELTEFKGELRELQGERTNYILELGEAAYSKFREGEMIELASVEKIKQLDKRIFDLLKKINEKKIVEDGKVCECGNKLTLDDKFCKECGKRVEEIREADIKDMVECSTCKTLNLNSNNYCNCCGHRLV